MPFWVAADRINNLDYEKVVWEDGWKRISFGRERCIPKNSHPFGNFRWHNGIKGFIGSCDALGGRKMRGSSTYLPNLPLTGEDGTWDSIRDLIERHLLPALEQRGAFLFLPSLRPIPQGASIVPIVSDDWSKPRRDQTPQFVFLVAGNGQMLVEHQWLSLPAGQGVFLPKGALYAPYAMVNGCIVPCEWLWFKVHPFGIVVLRSRLTFTAHFQSAHYTFIDRCLPQLFQEWKRETFSRQPHPIVSKGLLVAFFGMLRNLSPLPRRTLKIFSDRSLDLPLSIQQAVAILHRAYNKPLTLVQLAQHCGVSAAHLCRLFRQHLGMSPWQYLKRLRLEVARQLLKETDLSVADVAFLAGYRDLRHFQRAFRRAYGVTPSQSRRAKKRSTPIIHLW